MGGNGTCLQTALRFLVTMPISTPSRTPASVLPTGEEPCVRPGGLSIEGWNPSKHIGSRHLPRWLPSLPCVVFQRPSPPTGGTCSGVRAMEVEARLNQTSREASPGAALALGSVFPAWSRGRREAAGSCCTPADPPHEAEVQPRWGPLGRSSWEHIGTVLRVLLQLLFSPPK